MDEACELLESIKKACLERNRLMWGPQLAWKGSSTPGGTGFFHSQGEGKPWLRIKLNRAVVISSVTITNRLDCCGERLRNLEIRGGMKRLFLTNPVIGKFKGPGTTGGVHKIQVTPSKVLYLSFQQTGNAHVLQINGIKLGFAKGKNTLCVAVELSCENDRE